ncbi:transcriptional regulator [Gibbsiella greigii]
MKVPSSFRFPERLMNSLRARAESKNKSLTEHVQSVLEASLDNEDFEKKHYYELMENPESGLSNIYIKLFSTIQTQATRLSFSEIKFMLHYCHAAYLSHSHAVNNDYVKIIIDITTELVRASISNNIPYDEHYVFRCLDLSNNDLDASIKNIKEATNKCIDGAYAEYLMRPLQSGAFNLTQYPKETIDLIFTKERLQKLFPVITRGVSTRNNKSRVIKELSQTLPSHRINFSVSELTFSIVCHGNDFHHNESASVFFLIEGEHFIKPYSVEKVLALLRLITRDELDGFRSSGNESDMVTVWPPNTLSEQGIIDIDSFRLLYKTDLYSEFKKKFIKTVSDEKTSNIISSMKIMYGDI